VTRATEIHETAIVDAKASLGQGVRVGPYTIIHGDVVIGDGTEIGPHVVIENGTRIGSGNRIFQFATIGSAPQDLKYGGEPTLLEIGNDNTIREFASLNRGTEGGGGVTRIGDSNMVMSYSHVAHDCQVGSSVVLANCATMGGHVTVEDYAILGGLVAVHQHVRIGQSAMLGGGSAVVLDVPPYCMAHGNRAKLVGLNVVGLKRRGLSPEAIAEIKGAYRTLFRCSLPLTEALSRLADEYPASEYVRVMRDFVGNSERGVCR
jgi:UDP-N-acetylglucosamine acyltransferase